MGFAEKKERMDILMMTGFHHKTRTQHEICNLFIETWSDWSPINQSTVIKIEKSSDKGRPHQTEENK